MSDTKVCPRCAEDVKAQAQVCRYCGHEFGVSLDKNQASPIDTPSAAHMSDTATDEQSGPSATDQDHVIPNKNKQTMIIVASVLAAIVVVVAIAFGLAGWTMSGTKPVETTDTGNTSAIVSTIPAAVPSYEAIPVGTQIVWAADKAGDETVRQAGPYVVKITKTKTTDGTAAVVTVTEGAQSVSMTGDGTDEGSESQIALVANGGGAPPFILFQSFTGGAHCCNHMQVAGDFGGVLKAVDLGSWDGDSINPPTDVSGDGYPDFVMRDNSFLYTFAAYAMSSAPPQIMDVVDGKVINVSTKPAFRKLFAKEMLDDQKICVTGDDGMTRNGACAAYVAEAARVGHLNEAWPIMLQHYSAEEEWTYPTGCSVAVTKGKCPDAATITYKSYPESLLAFLKKQGYVPRGWMPPEAYAPDVSSVGAGTAAKTQGPTL